MATALNYSAPIPPINMECTSMKEEWQRWIDSFEMYSFASKLDKEDDKVQRVTLLHLAGPAVQTILSNLTGDKASTKNVKDRLTEFFAPKGNKWAERYRFKCRVQQTHESTDKFVSDLRKLGSTCSFADLDEQIISQIIERCHNPKIREKLLTEGDGLTLEKAMTVARTFEQTQESAAMMNSSTSTVSKIVQKPSKKPSVPKSRPEKSCSDQKCFACGRSGHFRGAAECKAKNATCRFCTKKGQFDSVCRKKLAQKTNGHDSGQASTKHITADEQFYEMVGKVSSLHSDSWFVSTQIDGVELRMQVDTGSKYCIIPLSFLPTIGKAKHQLKPAMNFKGYGQKPLSCIGMFTAKLSLSGRHIKTDFYVMDENDNPLMGLLAARGLIDAKIKSLSMSSKAGTQDSQSSTTMPDVFQKYPQLFRDNLEPIKNFSYDIQIDPNATPIAQKERVPSYAVQSWTKDEIQKMLSLNVIEECTESRWISPVHVVLNESKEPRLTIDLRLVNKAIIRHHYPMPKV